MRKAHLNISISRDVADALRMVCGGNVSQHLESILREKLSIPAIQTSMPTSQECAECGQEKDRKAFVVNKGNGKIATSIFCPKCRKNRLKPESKEKMLRSQRKRYWKNHERELARNKAYYESNRELVLFKQNATVNRERKNERGREHWLEHREDELNRGREYYLANPEKVDARVREWRRRNPERIRSYWAQRRVKTSGIDIQSIRGRIEVYGHTCAYCGAPYDHIDHVIPIARGGRHIAANLRPACKKCNLRKGSKKYGEWKKIVIKERGRIYGLPDSNVP
jgi:5-methylcytosine-specific restriction endonuclease McrA